MGFVVLNESIHVKYLRQWLTHSIIYLIIILEGWGKIYCVDKCGKSIPNKVKTISKGKELG